MASVRSQPSKHAEPVSISQPEHLRLIKISRQYSRLRQNLLRSGIDENTIARLSNVASSSSSSSNCDQDYAGSEDEYSTSDVQSSCGGDAIVSASKNNKHHRAFKAYSSRRYESDWSEGDPPSEVASVSVDMSNGGVPIAGSSVTTQVPSGPQIELHATRTIQFLGLPCGATHVDIVEATRGGQLVDVFLRHQYRTGNVSFLYGEDAKAFFARARHRGLYIKGQRVDLIWNDQQFTLNSFIANKIRGGASRTILIYNCNSDLSEETIRADLDHVYNLVVIKVEFSTGHCSIQTNSVSKAIVARTCMLSRQKYRSYQFGWGQDECDEPLDEIPALDRVNTPSVTASISGTNRFKALSFDAGGNTDDDFYDSDDTVQ